MLRSGIHLSVAMALAASAWKTKKVDLSLPVGATNNYPMKRETPPSSYGVRLPTNTRKFLPPATHCQVASKKRTTHSAIRLWLSHIRQNNSSNVPLKKIKSQFWQWLLLSLLVIKTSHFSNRRVLRGIFLLDRMSGQSLMVQKAQLKACLYLINERLFTNYLNNLDIYIQKSNKTICRVTIASKIFIKYLIVRFNFIQKGTCIIFLC